MQTADSAELTANDALLKVPAPDTFAEIWQRSPFTFATIAPPTSINPPKWSDQYDLGGYGKIDDVETVTLVDRATQKTVKVTKNAPNALGITFVAFEYNPDRKHCKAVLRKNNDKGEVKYRAPVAPAIAPTTGVDSKAAPSSQTNSPTASPTLGNQTQNSSQPATINKFFGSETISETPPKRQRSNGNPADDFTGKQGSSVP